MLVFAPDGSPIGRIALPERCANVCFGGAKRNRLFMAASHVPLRALRQHPGRPRAARPGLSLNLIERPPRARSRPIAERFAEVRRRRRRAHAKDSTHR